MVAAEFIDAHFHLDLFKDPAPIIAECEARSILTIAVTNAPSVFFHTQRLASSTKLIRASVGLHPELVHSHAHELPDMLRLMSETRFIGEVGLDYCTTDETLRAKQRKVFEAILDRAASLGDRVLSIHSRRAAGDVIKSVGTAFKGVAILHWFSGSSRELDRAIEAGFYFSVNPAMVQSKSGRTLIAGIPAERLLTETDGPFVEIKGTKLTPRSVQQAVNGVAEVWGASVESVARTIRDNLKRLGLIEM